MTVTKDQSTGGDDDDGGGGASKVQSVATSSPVAADGYWPVCLTEPIAPALGNHTVRFSGAPSGSSAVNKGVLTGNVILWFVSRQRSRCALAASVWPRRC